MAHCTRRKSLKTGAAASMIASTGALPLPAEKQSATDWIIFGNFNISHSPGSLSPRSWHSLFRNRRILRRNAQNARHRSQGSHVLSGRATAELYLAVRQLDANFLEMTPQAENQPAEKSGNPACQLNRSMQPI